MAENLAAKLCALIPNESVKVGWTEENQTLDDSLSSHSVLHHFPSVLNIVQATINQNHTLLGYIVKETIKVSKENEDPENKDQNEEEKKDPLSDACLDSELEVYQAYILELESDDKKIHTVITERRKQVRIQFLYKQKRQTGLDKFIVLIHHECIVMYTALFNSSSDIDTIKELKSETIVRTFTWAQWDSTNQVLYHIHNRRAPTSLVTEEDNESRSKATNSCPTLSGLQFHDELPHETVLNIPLNLPRPPSADNCGTYEDDVIPLRVHDCSLDLIVISNSKGMVCVCHHYLYRPIQPPQHVLNASLSDSNTVHFAYSVTLLHHSCVIHCVVPGIPWSQAKLMRPTFAIAEDYMVVFVQGSFTHLLEIGASHDPSCHILCGSLPTIYSHASYLVPLLDLNSNKTVANKKSGFLEAQDVANIMTIDLPTLDLIPLKVTADFLIDVFKKESSVHVRLGIIHYFMCHKHDLEIVAGLISIIAEKPRALDVVKFMQEILIGNSYSLVQKNLLPDAVPLLSLLPITTVEECVGYDAKIGEFNITLSHEKLWNTSVMLLSPQQRLVPYRSDLWTRLWDNLGKRSESKPRFKFSQITEKLLVSLACYQPEVLSRSSTPMSPSGGLVLATGSFGDLMSNRSNKILDSALPFIEVENCTASRQEHIVAVNLRELSMYLLKHATNAPATSYVACSPLQVHAMATRHIAAQLESSRSLCQMLCRAANVDPRLEQERGFVLIDQLDEIRRNLLFTLLERYRYAIEIIAFPVPQGFSSFFTYLGYRSLKYPMFLQYVERSLHLLSLLPRSRAKRLLNQWLHPVSFMIRAREHAGNILSGEICQNRGRTLQHCHRHNGLAAFPSADRLSPLDTFLDLLTAKASLAELDFGLLIEATVTSTEDFL
ncbi:Similar to pigeon: Protein pigeon (Drosophila melanogaster) [Cotesia congregata]|uniref:Similar to pigeon: Protein pigeon (Drosophila melanogaster) n=1 Tax=Cotesia congregata TaxID=51543 RepID=A0A8J2HG37_COTCN|nr:Similar to pigeon: Protein pigeon (Drosophila melanogaster) [Cotesia congregata]